MGNASYFDNFFQIKIFFSKKCFQDAEEDAGRIGLLVPMLQNLFLLLGLLGNKLECLSLASLSSLV